MSEEKVTKKEMCYANRELSWLKFNERVLDEAADKSVPLCERMSFFSIFQSNLDEFYMVRVGSLYDQMLVDKNAKDNKTGMTCKEQLKAIFEATRIISERKDHIYKEYMEQLKAENMELVSFSNILPEDKAYLENYFTESLLPLLSPQVIGKKQPFPFLKNKEIYAVVVLGSKNSEKLGIIPCSNEVFKRLIPVPSGKNRFILVEDVILHYLSRVFDHYTIKSKSLIRIIRNADIDVDEAFFDEDLDYRDSVERLNRTRKKLCPVKLEYSRVLDDTVIEHLRKELGLFPEQIFYTEVPLELSFLFQIQDCLRGKRELFYEKRVPQNVPDIVEREPMIDQIQKKDCLLSYPFESMKPFIRLLREAGNDKRVVSIKMTLYRVARDSQIGEEAAEVFHALCLAQTVDETKYLLVAPKCLQNKIISMVEEEIKKAKAGEDAYIGIKMNSFTDKVLIDKFIEASQAGVKIDLIVRGICCLVPGVKGFTENISVISVVGRFLEHSRIYIFGKGEAARVYISSADFMTRNTVRRVEVAVPIRDEDIKNRLMEMFGLILRDNVKASVLKKDGNYFHRETADIQLNSQEYFYTSAYQRMEEAGTC